MSDLRPVVVASHMRSGTHLTIDLLRRNSDAVSVSHLDIDRLAPGHGSPLSLAGLDAELARMGDRPILKTHWPHVSGWFPDGCERSARAKALIAGADLFYVARDGRDVLVSLYFYARHYNDRARRQGFGEFLRDRDDFFHACPELAELDRASAWARHVETWLSDPRATALHYDDLVQHPEPTLRFAMAKIGLPAPQHVASVPVPSGIPRRVLRKLLAPIRPRHVSSAIAARGGGSGGWRQHFSPRDEAFFQDRAGAALARVASVVRGAASAQETGVGQPPRSSAEGAETDR